MYYTIYFYLLLSRYSVMLFAVDCVRFESSGVYDELC